MKDLTFAKVMIALCLIGSGLLAWHDWKGYKRIQGIKDALRPNGQVEVLVRQTQAHGKEYAQLQKLITGDELEAEGRALSYITAIADRPLVDIGQVDVQTTQRPDVNTIDHVYSITPTVRDRDFARMSIANFLFSLEDNSRRIRVTRLKLDQLNRDNPKRPRPKVTEYPSDRYNFTAEVTSRERKDGGQ